MQAHALTRVDRCAALGEREFDVLVIGGGITGCGIAREAALHGLAVALVERDDFGSGTSSRSSRLIHGGVRYLEHGHIHLVFESSRERQRLLRLAPHLVRPLAFTWPVYDGARISRWKLGAGLILYDALSLFRNVQRHRRLDARGVLEHEPLLRRDGLRGGARYYDAATDDARLTLANAVGAMEAGATVVNHAGAIELAVEQGRVAGAVVRDALADRSIMVRARVVVNATGPWSDDVRRLDERTGATVRGSKGAHLAVQRDRIGNNGALTLLSPRDGRVLFVLPAGSQAIVGTTDSYTTSTPDEARATNEDVQYLIDAVNGFFPNATLSRNDVVAAWAGIRPLLPAASSGPGAVSREHAINTSARGLISITGGKLTTYRVMAKQVVALVLQRLARPIAKIRSHTVALPGGDFDSFDSLLAAAARETNDIDLAARLVHAHGTRWTKVWSVIGEAGGATRVNADLPYTIGELRYAVRHEMAHTLGDLLIRRTHLAFESRDHGVGVADSVAEAIGPLFGWTTAQQRREIEDYERETANTFAID